MALGHALTAHVLNCRQLLVAARAEMLGAPFDRPMIEERIGIVNPD